MLSQAKPMIFKYRWSIKTATLLWKETSEINPREFVQYLMRIVRLFLGKLFDAPIDFIWITK